MTLSSPALPCSVTVRGRRPLGRDPELDYEVESDQEWEEEPEGESLSVSQGGGGMSMSQGPLVGE